MISVATGLLFGLAPAIRSARLDSVALLGSRNASGSLHQTGRFTNRIRRGLVGLQIAFSVVLVIVAGLFVESLENLRSIKLGFNPDSLLLFNVDAQNAGYAAADRRALYQQLLERFDTIPGVKHASLSSSALPLNSGAIFTVTVPGVTPPEQGKDPDNPLNFVGVALVGPKFFETMQIPLTLGHEFADGTTVDGPLARW